MQPNTQTESNPLNQSQERRPDKENAFLLYATFCGDSARTAAALNMDEEVVRALAVENGWDKKLKPIIDLKNSTKAGDVERAINRAINFVDAHKLRGFLARVIFELTGMNNSDLKAFLFPETSEAGAGERVRIKKFSTRALADLAAAVEKCQALTYIALNDSATERRERKEDGTEDEATASEMHVKLAAAMAAAGSGSKSIRGLVLDAQTDLANQHAEVEVKTPDGNISSADLAH